MDRNLPIFIGELSPREMVAAIRKKLAPLVNRTDIAILSDGEDELSIPLDRVRVGFNQGFIVVEMAVWSPLLGESIVVIPFRVSNTRSRACLRVETEATPRGDRWLMEQWGEPLQEVIWDAVMSIAHDFINVSGCDANVIGFYCDGERFGYAFQELSVAELASVREPDDERLEESTLELLMQLAQSVDWKKKAENWRQNSIVWSRTTLRNLHFWETRVVEYIKGNF